VLGRYRGCGVKELVSVGTYLIYVPAAVETENLSAGYASWMKRTAYWVMKYDMLAEIYTLSLFVV